jgi:hypothetical protein
VLPYGALWYAEPNAIASAISYAKFRSRSHDAVIRVYDDAGNVIETHEHAGMLFYFGPDMARSYLGPIKVTLP